MAMSLTKAKAANPGDCVRRLNILCRIFAADTLSDPPTFSLYPIEECDERTQALIDQPTAYHLCEAVPRDKWPRKEAPFAAASAQRCAEAHFRANGLQHYRRVLAAFEKFVKVAQVGGLTPAHVAEAANAVKLAWHI